MFQSTLLQEIPLPNPLSESDINQLYQQLRQSEDLELKKKAADELIEHHLRLGMSIAMSMARHSKSRTEDCVSTMCLTLVNGVKLISEGAIDHHKEPNITGYLIKAIRSQLIRFISRDRLVSVCLESSKKKEVKKLYFPESMDRVVPTDGTSFFELRELLESANLDSTERQVVACRINGETDAEIADHLLIKGRRVTRKRVFQIRSGIAKRLTELMK